MDFGDILHPDGSDNTGGLKGILYLAPMSEVDVSQFPVVPADPANEEAAVTITADIVFNTDGYFRELYVTLETAELMSAMVGEVDGKSFENTWTGIHPTNRKKILGFLEWVKNTNMCVLVPEMDGSVRLMGSPLLPAKIDAGEVKSGAKVADLKSVSLTFKSIGKISPYYEGAIQRTPAI